MFFRCLIVRSFVALRYSPIASAVPEHHVDSGLAAREIRESARHVAKGKESVHQEDLAPSKVCDRLLGSSSVVQGPNVMPPTMCAADIVI